MCHTSNLCICIHFFCILVARAQGDDEQPLRVLLFEGQQQLTVEEERTADARRDLETVKGELDTVKRELVSVKRDLIESRAGGVKGLMESAIAIAEANSKAEKAIAEANSKAEKAIAEANSKAEKAIAAANAKAETALRECAALRKECAALRASFNAAIAAIQAVPARAMAEAADEHTMLRSPPTKRPRKERLYGAHEVQRLNRGIDEAIAWISEKEAVLASYDYGKELAACQALQLKHEAVERDLAALADKVDGLRREGAKLTTETQVPFHSQSTQTLFSTQ